ncbi:MAG: hypothetical protein V3U44_05680, partial [Alphaproteobacteria bacterium]
MSDIPQPIHFHRQPIVAAILGGIVAVSSTQILMAGANPPAVKNPTLMLAAACNPCNPCAAKNPCNPCNPCGGANIAARDFMRPVGVAGMASSSAL